MDSYVQLFGWKLPIQDHFTIPIGGGINIYWYGILIAIGFALAVLYAFRRAKDFGVDPDKIIDILLLALPLAIVGARLYYFIFNPGVFDGFWDIFNIRRGGLAIYGGIIGAIAGGAIMCKIRKVNFVSMLDLAAMGFLIGQAVGRWGNFVNQEAYGGPTGSSWFGMTGDQILYDTGSTDLVHPCFLYESLWCIAGFIVLHILSKHRKFKGQMAVTYLIWYGFGRFFIEGLRTDSLMLGSSNIRVSQVLSALMVAAGVILYIVLLRRVKNQQDEPAYTPVFLDAETGEPVAEVLEESEAVLEEAAQDEESQQDVETEAPEADPEAVETAESKEEQGDGQAD